MAAGREIVCFISTATAAQDSRDSFSMAHLPHDNKHFSGRRRRQEQQQQQR
jgi:hypothetical protein